MVELILHLLEPFINYTSDFVLARGVVVFNTSLRRCLLLKAFTNLTAHAQDLAAKLTNESFDLSSETSPLGDAVFDGSDDTHEVVIENIGAPRGRLRIPAGLILHDMLNSLRNSTPRLARHDAVL
jgi:hypothetical protein